MIPILDKPKVHPITASDTLEPNEQTVLADASDGAIVVTLPPMTQCIGKIFSITKVDSNAGAGNKVEILVNDDDAIDFTALEAYDLDAQYDRVLLYADGYAWHVIATDIA